MRVFCELMRKTSAVSNALELATQVLEGVECLAKPSPVSNTASIDSSMSYDVFLSHSMKDDGIVSKLKELLSVVAQAIFQSKGRISPGTSWREVVFTSLANARIIVVFWSCNTLKSIEVTREWVAALQLDKVVIPVLLDPTPLDPLLAEIQVVDLQPIIGIQASRHMESQGGAGNVNLVTFCNAALKLLEAIQRAAEQH
jgi:hypothetical protein